MITINDDDTEPCTVGVWMCPLESSTSTEAETAAAAAAVAMAHSLTKQWGARNAFESMVDQVLEQREQNRALVARQLRHEWRCKRQPGCSECFHVLHFGWDWRGFVRAAATTNNININDSSR